MSTIEEAREQARETLADYHRVNAGGYGAGHHASLARALRALLDATEPPKPAEDEREALDGAIGRLSEYVNAGSIVHLASSYRTGDGKIHFIDFDDLREVLNAAAGYSKGPRPITDEMVEAAAEALRPGLFTGSLAQYERRYDNYGADVRAAHQETVLEDVRAALEAAEEARR